MSRDSELIATVAADLEYLNTWVSVDDQTLRRSSVILRRLVNQGDYGLAWRAAGFEREPHVTAPRLEAILDSSAAARVRSAIAGGGVYSGREIGMFLEERPIPLDPRSRELPPPMPLFAAKDYEWLLGKFASSCGIFAEGRRIKRLEVIGYVANVLGGAHFDETLRKAAYTALQSYNGRFELLTKNPVYFELMSIGQLISRAPGAQRLIAVAS